MPKYLFKTSYTSEGAQGVKAKGGSARAKAIEEMVRNLGGTLESFYFAFGVDDAYTIVDLPDNVSAAAISLAVAATGAAGAETVVLVTPEEMDQAAQKEVGYSPPGQ